MKKIIAYLAGANSIHTVRWANALCELDYEIHIISLKKPDKNHIYDKKINIHILPYYNGLGYLLNAKKVKKILAMMKPKLVHAHYASGYGTLARLVNYRPWIISAWGSDVLIFPYKSFIHKYLIKRNLVTADRVLSTSQSMADEIILLFPELKNVFVTPFGIDLSLFKKKTSCSDNSKIIIGTVKSMSDIYGIDVLIHSFSLLFNKLQLFDKLTANKLRLYLVGDGEDLGKYKMLTKNYKISSITKFISAVPHSEVPQILNKFNVFVALSRSESFGVAILEASASQLPVVVTKIGGLMEVVVDNVTGIIVDVDDPKATAEALYKLIMNADMRIKFGNAGRDYVRRNYNWEKSVNRMTNIYNEIIND